MTLAPDITDDAVLASMFNRPTITVARVFVWGKWRYQPVCGRAKALASLTGRQTLTADNLQTIRDAGFEIEEFKGRLPGPFDGRRLT